MDDVDDPTAAPFYSGCSSTRARQARYIKVASEEAGGLVGVEQKRSRRGNPRAWNPPGLSAKAIVRRSLRYLLSQEKIG
jgi:hypothetical protein